MTKVAIGYRDVVGPWGGGNRFVKSLKNELIKNGFVYTSNLKDKDIDIILLTDPRFRLRHVSFSIAQIIFYKFFVNPKVKVIHRVNECDERKNTNYMNKLLIKANWCADYTVFVGTWLTELKCWKENIRTPYRVILNGSDKKIFNNSGYKCWEKKGPIKLVTHHWGGNLMKGFDIYSKIDQMLNEKKWKSKISFTYIGNLPKGFEFQNVKYIKPLDGLELAKELKKHHVYLTASINEPGGNHQNEGALCGLPLLYRDSGCMPEYCEGFGIMFNEETFVSSLLKMRKDYFTHVANIENFPYSSDLTNSKYLKLINELSNDKFFSDNKKRFFNNPIKTIMSLLVI